MLSSEDQPSILDRTAHGARLLTMRGAAMRVVSIAANLGLVALVAPADLGLLAIVRGVTGVAGTSSDLGFAWALLRRAAPPTDDEYGALAGMQLLLIGAFVAAAAAAPSLLTSLAAVPPGWRVAMILVLAAMLVVPLGTGARIRLERELDFRRIAVVDMSSVLLQNLALVGFAVVHQFALGVFVSTGVTLLYTNLLFWLWSPGAGPRFNFPAWRRLTREFAGFSVGHVGSVLGAAVTPIVIARLFGLTTAGLWALAVRLGNVLQLAFEGFRRAAVPAAALLSDTSWQLRMLAQTTVEGAARLTIPMAAAMVAGLPLLGWLLPRWAPAVLIAQLYLLGFGLTSVLAAGVIPVAVALRGPWPVIVEQYTPVAVGWAALGLLRVVGSPRLEWAIVPMFASLLVATVAVGRATVLPQWTPRLVSLVSALGVSAAAVLALDAIAAARMFAPVAGVAAFALVWMMPRLSARFRPAERGSPA